MPRISPVLNSTSPLKKFNNYKKHYTYKIVYPPILRDFVSDKKEKLSGAHCIEEMSLMFRCWKDNEFDHSKCSSQLGMFQKCMRLAETQEKARRLAHDQGKTTSLSGKYSSAQVNKMLKLYPQPPHTIDKKFYE